MCCYIWSAKKNIVKSMSSANLLTLNYNAKVYMSLEDPGIELPK